MDTDTLTDIARYGDAGLYAPGSRPEDRRDALRCERVARILRDRWGLTTDRGPALLTGTGPAWIIESDTDRVVLTSRRISDTVEAIGHDATARAVADLVGVVA